MSEAPTSPEVPMGDENGGSSTFVTQTELRALESNVETQISGLATSVGQLTDAVKADRALQEKRDQEFRETIERQGREFREEMRADREARKTPQSTVIGAFGLIATLAAMAGALTVFAINGAVAPVKKDVEKNTAEIAYQRSLTDTRLRWEGAIEERLEWVKMLALKEPELENRVEAIETLLGTGFGGNNVEGDSP